MQLYNTLSAKEREALLEEAGQERLTLSFYQYAHIGNPDLFRNHLFIAWNEMEVLGRIYVAKEGINGQLSVPATRFLEFKEFLDGIYFLNNVRLNIAVDQDLYLDLVTALGQGVELNQVVAGLGTRERPGGSVDSAMRVCVNVFKLKHATIARSLLLRNDVEKYHLLLWLLQLCFQFLDFKFESLQLFLKIDATLEVRGQVLGAVVGVGFPLERVG